MTITINRLMSEIDDRSMAKNLCFSVAIDCHRFAYFFEGQKKMFYRRNTEFNYITIVKIAGYISRPKLPASQRKWRTQLSWYCSEKISFPKFRFSKARAVLSTRSLWTCTHLIDHFQCIRMISFLLLSNEFHANFNSKWAFGVPFSYNLVHDR